MIVISIAYRKDEQHSIFIYNDVKNKKTAMIKALKEYYNCEKLQYYDYNKDIDIELDEDKWTLEEIANIYFNGDCTFGIKVV